MTDVGSLQVLRTWIQAKGSFLLAGLLVLVTLGAYLPAIQGGFIWDDDSYVTENQTLRDLNGLRRIWFEPGAVPQYYPLVHTTFWIEYHLWQLHPLGYHLTNVLLHAIGALLLCTTLARLNVPGAWLAAFLFALHPVHVESVAWVTERKNVLSGVFYLSALQAYVRYGLTVRAAHEISRRWVWYVVALLLFLCALLSKTVTASLPAALLLILWWRRARLAWRDVEALVPFFVFGIALGLLTVWMEKQHVGAEGEEWRLSVPARILIAGRALWFYAGRLFWPGPLAFNYPRWQVDAALRWQYLYPGAALAVVVVLWIVRRRIGRGPLVAVLFFGGTLLPALGFFNVFPFRYSFVADHFQYLASLGLIVLFAAVTTVAVRRFGPSANQIGRTGSVLLLAGLCPLVWKQARVYRDEETLWRDTIAKNPQSWIAHNNLAKLLSKQGYTEDAVAHYRAAARLRVDPQHHNNLGIALAQLGRLDEAIDQYRAALALKPNFSDAHSNLGVALHRQGKRDEALQHYALAVRINPKHVQAHVNLGIVLAEAKRLHEAVAAFQAALNIEPDLSVARANLGLVYAHKGQIDAAVRELEKAHRIKPLDADTLCFLGNLLTQRGRWHDAAAAYEEVLRRTPAHAGARQGLERVRAGGG